MLGLPFPNLKLTPSLSFCKCWFSRVCGKNHVITGTNLEVKWHSCSSLLASYGSRLRHIHIAHVWVVSYVLYSRAITTLEFLLMSLGFNYFLLLRMSKTLSGGGGVGYHKMHIFTTNIPTFHARYKRLVPITKEFHEFYWSNISGTSDDEKASYGPKSIHIFLMFKTRASLR
jgi:hypothetical protein